MRHHHVTWLRRVLEFGVVTFATDAQPALMTKAFDEFGAIHVY